MLFFLPGHLPPEIPELRPEKEHMRKAVIDLRYQPFDLGETEQNIERRLLAHFSFNLCPRNPKSRSVSECRTTGSTRVLK